MSKQSTKVTKYRRSFLNVVGGKTYTLPRLMPTIETPIKIYHEPFVGGGALYINLMEHIDHAYLADANYDLINCWLAIQNNLDEYYDHLASLDITKNKETLDKHKRAWSSTTNKIHKAALYTTISKMAIYGRMRRKKNGGLDASIDWHSVKEGRSGRPDRKYATLLPYDFYKTLSEHLQRATIRCQNYAQTKPNPGDLVFLDPPYLSLAPDGGVKYEGWEQFTERDQGALCARARVWNKHGIHIRYCNYGLDFIYRNMPGFKTLTLTDETQRKSHWSKRALEVLFYN